VRSGKARHIAFWGGLAIIALATLPPFVRPDVRSVLMAAFSGVCHQLPARSPHVDGVSLAVCFRCYGIYWGFPVAAVLYPAIHRMLGAVDRRAPLVLALSLVPIGIDWSLEMVGLVPGSATLRTVTGLLFGVTAGYFLVVAIVRTASRRTG